MGHHCAGFARCHAPAGADFAQSHLGRYLLCGAHRLPMALPPQKLSKVANRLLLLLALAEKRRVGYRISGSPRPGAHNPRPSASADRGGGGLAKYQNHRKRGPRGWDGAKKVKGRKRFGASDTQGNLLESVVLPANTGERDGAWQLLQNLKASPLGQNIILIRADEGFAGAEWQARIQAYFGWHVEIVRKPPGQVGFALLPRRWVIEQTFGCWGRYRRLSKDYEQNPSSSRATLQLAAIHRALRRLRPAPSDRTATTNAHTRNWPPPVVLSYLQRH